MASKRGTRRRRRDPQTEWLETTLALVWEVATEYKWSVNRIAEEAGLSWATVDRLWSGVTYDPRSSTIRKVMAATGVTVAAVRLNVGHRKTTKRAA